MIPNTKLFIIFLLECILVLQLAQLNPICKSPQGDNADYWYIRKLPFSDSYLYFDNVNQNVLYESDIKLSTSALGRTIDQIKSNSYYLLYNGLPLSRESLTENPESFGTSDQSTKLYSKGILSFGNTAQTLVNTLENTSGFLIKHTLPGFPTVDFKTPSENPTAWYPKEYHVENSYTTNGDIKYSHGNSFFCFSFQSVSDVIELVQFSNPFIYKTNFYPTSLTSLQPIFQGPTQSSVNRKTISLPNSNLSLKLFSGNLNIFTEITSDAFPFLIENNVVTAKIVKEVQLPIEFSSQFDIKGDQSRFRVGTDFSQISFNANNSEVCIIETHTLSIYHSVLCFNSDLLSAFLQSMTMKYQIGTYNETDFNTPQVFKGTFVMEAPQSDNYQFPDTLLTNTKIQLVSKWSNTVLQGMKETISFQTDSNGQFQLKKNYQPELKCLLEDPVNHIKIINQQGEVISVSMVNQVTYYQTPSDPLVRVYKTLQLLVQSLPTLFQGTNINLATPLDITIQINDTTSNLYLNNLMNSPMNRDNIDSVFRTFSYNLLTKVNPGLQTSLQGLDINLSNSLDREYQDDKHQPFLLGLINFIAIQMKSMVYKDLTLQFKQRFFNVDLENFQVPSTNGVNMEGWITALLIDLVDQENDFNNHELYQLDNNQDETIPLSFIINATQSITTTDNIISFMDRLLSLSLTSTQISLANDIMTYNNIFKCPQLCYNTSPEPYTGGDKLVKYLYDNLICPADVNRVGSTVLQEVFNNFIHSEVEDFNSVTTLMSLAIRTFKECEPIDEEKGCLYNIPEGKMVPLDSMVMITSEINELIDQADYYIEYGQDLVGYLIENLKSYQQYNNYVLYTYKGKICSFVPNAVVSQFSQDKYINSCNCGPIVSHINPTSGPTDDSPKITVTGRKLNLSTKVFIGDKECVVSNYYKSGLDDIIICNGESDTGVQVVTFQDPASPLPVEEREVDIIYSFYKPVIEQVINYQNLIPNRGLVTIKGQNLPTDNTAEVIVLLSDFPQEIQEISTQINPVTQQSESIITFTPLGVGTGNFLELIIDGQSTGFISTWSIDFREPVITGITPTSGNPWSLVTITGQLYNSDLMLSDLYSFNLVNEEYDDEDEFSIEIVEWLDENTVVGMAPERYGQNLYVKMIFANQIVFAKTVRFSYLQPVIDHMVHDKFMTNQSNYFWLVGRNLYPDFYQIVVTFLDDTYVSDCVEEPELYPQKTLFYDEEGELYTGGIPTSQLPNAYDPYLDLDPIYRTTVEFQSYICLFGSGIGTGFEMNLYINDEPLYSDFSVGFGQPTVLELTASNETLFSTKGGSMVTVYGENFVPNENLNPGDESFDGGRDYSNVFINGFESPNITWTSSIEIQFEIPPGIGYNLSVQIMVGLQFNYDHNVTFSYDKPKLQENSSYTSPTVGDKWITITGDNFVPQELATNQTLLDNLGFENSIRIGNHSCLEVKWLDNHNASCKVPPGTGKELSITVTVGNQTSEPNQFFSYDQPNIVSILPNRGRKSNNTVITIKGVNFGSNANESIELVSVLIGDIQCTNVQYLTLPVEQGEEEENYEWIQCTVPSITTDPTPEENIVKLVVVKVNSQISQNNDTTFEFYGPPKLISVSPTSGTIDGGVDLTITGNNFIEHQDNDTLKIQFNGKTLESTSIKEIKMNKIIFTTVKGGGKDIDLHVILNQQESNHNTQYHYNQALLESLSPSTSDKDVPMLVTFIGNDLGLSGDFDDPVIHFGDILTENQCTTVVVTSSHSLTCTSPTSTTVGIKSVTLTFYSQESSNSLQFEYTDGQQDTTSTTTTPLTTTPVIGGPVSSNSTSNSTTTTTTTSSTTGGFAPQ
ncbi:IPT/TIG domain-containing protein [Tieghemostelium lacteum]|uniref:IPT/TIG domain-containing protein n=1 Tax=Tieghemostelium lacteum TaxID=361077 RepID=A0A151Z6U6_TIELA|nr:IPT/TIG domain-containing protein [Tieghemostelium lacteum]|eukprot:KYQ89682.1 IPT/TIG domain-containing protein [Tieghemostelium lacteum]